MKVAVLTRTIGYDRSESRLKAMDLIDNKIDQILAPEDAEDFKSLEMLRLNGNTFQDYVSFDRLGLYPSLKTLWVGSRPVVNKQEEDSGDQEVDPRTLIVAKMERLEHLNGSDVCRTLSVFDGFESCSRWEVRKKEN